MQTCNHIAGNKTAGEPVMEKGTSPNAYEKGVTIVFFCLGLAGLFVIAVHNYLIFHTIIEIFTVVIGFTIFILAWNSRKLLDNNFFLFLGISFLYVSALDLLHALAYKGMGVFAGYDANLPTQFWIAARYVQSLSLLAAFSFFHRRLNIPVTLAGYTLITALLIAAIFTGYFPLCYVEGKGLTLFKKISEYLICLILLSCIALFWQKKKELDEKVGRWLILATALAIGTELVFTLYLSVYDFSNIIGHFFKLASFYFIYKAILKTGIEEPHQVLFRNLKLREGDLQEAIQEVQKLAITDSLTGLYNRRHFFDLLDREIQRASRYQHSLSTIMFDIDKFKDVNDSYGHAVGDQVLKELAECCRRELRDVDVSGRYGGEEFAIILPYTDLSAASEVAERLRLSIACTPFHTSKGEISITVSLGVAVMDDKHATTDSLIDLADQALYAAKQDGRNRVSTIN